ncbi:MAG: hypothetical protein JSR96_09980 [Proteobacteria bacterium]|nr:hypothetical protein [Pseudomonadota bacterium]
MSNASFALFSVGFGGGIICKIFGFEGSTFYYASALSLISGVLICLASGAARVLQGKVQLRPLDAMKSASMIFAVIVGIRFIIWLVFPSVKQDALEAFISAAGFAIGIGFYRTAYRKPA